MDNNEKCDCGGNCHHHFMPKGIVMALGGLLIVFVALLIVQKGHDIQSSFSNQKPANTISVSGEGKVSAVPDLATVNIGVLSQGTTATEVKNQNNDKVNKVIAFIKSQGIADKDITTTQYSFYPNQDYNNGTPNITGYQGNQSVTVKVHGVDKDQTILNKILDGVVNNGANQIDGTSLTVEKPTDLQNQARKLAIADAKVKAQELADEAGLKLGKVVSVSESSGGYPGPIPYAMNATYGMGGVAMDKSIAPDVQVGSQEISQTMTVVFEIK